MARREIVGAIEDHVRAAHEAREALRPRALHEGLDADVGIDLAQRGRRRFRLRLPERRLPVDDLPLQVREVDAIAVADRDATHAARGEVHERRGAEAARADHQRTSAEEALLRLLAELVQQEMAAVAKALV